MVFGRRLKALTSWFACFAILLSALGPALSHAVSARAPAVWSEICGVSGARLVELDTATDAGKSTDEGSGVHALKHCPFCATHAGASGLPPAAPTGLTLDGLAFHLPELFLAAPRTLFAWVSAQPRAPPLNA